MRAPTSGWNHSLVTSLVLLSPFNMLVSLGMDMYLPVIPLMADALDANAPAIQLTLSTYLLLIGAGQLLFGPVSDRIGRRPVLLAGALAFSCGSIGLASSDSFGPFMVFRIVQATGASACLVATFATVRDVYSAKQESTTIYGLLASALAVIPAAGPLVGAGVNHAMGWRGIFVILAVAMAAAAVAAWRMWPETLDRSAPQMTSANLLRPLASARFWVFTSCYVSGMGSFFVFFSVAPWVMTSRHGLSQLEFSLAFAIVAVAMILSARFVSRHVARWGEVQTLRMSMRLLMVGGCLLGLLEWFAPASLAGFVAPMILMSCGIAAAVSIAPNGALRDFGHMAGAATAIYFFTGGILIAVLGTLAISSSPHATTYPIFLFGVLSAALVSIANSTVLVGEASKRRQ